MKSIKKVRNVQKIDLGYLLKDIHLTYGVLLEKTGKGGIYLLKVNNWNTRERCEIGKKLTKKTAERRQ